VPPSEQLTLAASSSIPVGATVAVTLPERYLLLGAALVYGVPLAALLLGAAAAAAWFESDLAVAAGAALATCAGLLIASSSRRRLERATLQHLAVRQVASVSHDQADAV
jgi:positive regulator of sigma E activity